MQSSTSGLMGEALKQRAKGRREASPGGCYEQLHLGLLSALLSLLCSGHGMFACLSVHRAHAGWAGRLQEIPVQHIRRLESARGALCHASCIDRAPWNW